MAEGIRGIVCSHVGNSRQNHEDNYLLRKGEYLSPRARRGMEQRRETLCCDLWIGEGNFLTVLADGMGGHSSGEVASLMAVQYFSEHYGEIVSSEGALDEMLRCHIEALNREIVASSLHDPACRSMGTTLCGVILRKGRLVGFNVGDSRLYRYSEGALRQISADHTEGQRLLNLKLLSEEELAAFPRRKHLYKYMGINEPLIADVFDMGEGFSDVLLLCSDGLTDVLEDGEIEAVLGGEGTLSEKGVCLVERALARNPGYGDNITVILLKKEEAENDRKTNIGVFRGVRDRFRRLRNGL